MGSFGIGVAETEAGADRLIKLLDSAALLVTEVYAAGESPIAAADGRAICRAVRTRGKVEPVFVEKVETLDEALRAVLKPGDVLVTMGAGSISAVSHGLPQKLGASAARRKA